MSAEVLSSWKEIAAYLGRGRRTVQRWEKELGLPVRRLGDRDRGTVLAMTSDIDTWLNLKPIHLLSNGSARNGRSAQVSKAVALQPPQAAGVLDAELSSPVKGMLWENRELLDLICEHITQSFAVFDREMRYIRASRRWIAERGLDDIQIVGLCHYDLFPEIPERWRTIALRCLEGESASGQDDSYIRPDGRRTSLRWAVYPWHDATGEIGGLILFVERTDPLKRMTQALLESEERYRALLAASGQGVMLIDTDAVIRECNSYATRILGVQADELVGVSALDPRWKILSEDGAHFGGRHCPAVSALRSGKLQSGVVMGVRRPDGRIAWITANCQPLFRPGHTLPYSVLVAFSEVPAAGIRGKVTNTAKLLDPLIRSHISRQGHRGHAWTGR